MALRGLREIVRDDSEQLLLELGADPCLLLGPLAFADVPREAPRVDELPIPQEHVGVQQDVADLAVPRPHPCLAAGQGLVPREAGEDVRDHPGVDVELGDVPTDVLRLGVAEHLQLRAIGPQDDPVGAHPVQALGGVVDEVLQLLLALRQRRLRAPPVLEGLAQGLRCRKTSWPSRVSSAQMASRCGPVAMTTSGSSAAPSPAARKRATTRARKASPS